MDTFAGMCTSRAASMLSLKKNHKNESRSALFSVFHAIKIEKYIESPVLLYFSVLSEVLINSCKFDHHFAKLKHSKARHSVSLIFRKFLTELEFNRERAIE